jgi:mevalonate kinase
MSSFTGKGHGKFILMGEHAVVYGKPAIGTHLDRGVRVTLARTGRAAPPRAAPNHAPLAPRRLKITSRLPVGQGLGSSAALSVAVARAMLKAAGKQETEAGVIELAQVLETVFHGTPSGIDAALATGGGPLLYRKGRPPEPVRVGAPIPVIILLSGTSPSTRSMVQKVREQYERDRARTGALLDGIERLTLSALEAIRAGAPEDLGRLMDENHRLLFELGVSTPLLESLRKRALDAGSPGAKLTGGGGGGSVICIARSRRHAREIIKTLNMRKKSFMTIIENKEK